MLFDDSSTSGVNPQDMRPAPDAVLSGDPVSRAWEVLHDGTTCAGIREVQPGTYRVVCATREFTHILSGHAVIHQDGAAARPVGPGDSFTLRPGFRGVWEVRETLRREYVTGG
jgi:uncharacterized protein